MLRCFFLVCWFDGGVVGLVGCFVVGWGGVGEGVWWVVGMVWGSGVM